MLPCSLRSAWWISELCLILQFDSYISVYTITLNILPFSTQAKLEKVLKMPETKLYICQNRFYHMRKGKAVEYSIQMISETILTELGFVQTQFFAELAKKSFKSKQIISELLAEEPQIKINESKHLWILSRIFRNGNQNKVLESEQNRIDLIKLAKPYFLSFLLDKNTRIAQIRPEGLKQIRDIVSFLLYSSVSTSFRRKVIKKIKTLMKTIMKSGNQSDFESLKILLLDICSLDAFNQLGNLVLFLSLIWINGAKKSSSFSYHPVLDQLSSKYGKRSVICLQKAIQFSNAKNQKKETKYKSLTFPGLVEYYKGRSDRAVVLWCKEILENQDNENIIRNLSKTIIHTFMENFKLLKAMLFCDWIHRNNASYELTCWTLNLLASYLVKTYSINSLGLKSLVQFDDLTNISCSELIIRIHGFRKDFLKCAKIAESVGDFRCGILFKILQKLNIDDSIDIFESVTKLFDLSKSPKNENVQELVDLNELAKLMKTDFTEKMLHILTSSMTEILQNLKIDLDSETVWARLDLSLTCNTNPLIEQDRSRIYAIFSWIKILLPLGISSPSKENLNLMIKNITLMVNKYNAMCAFEEVVASFYDNEKKVTEKAEKVLCLGFHLVHWKIGETQLVKKVMLNALKEVKPEKQGAYTSQMEGLTKIGDFTVSCDNQMVVRNKQILKYRLMKEEHFVQFCLLSKPKTLSKKALFDLCPKTIMNNTESDERFYIKGKNMTGEKKGLLRNLEAMNDSSYHKIFLDKLPLWNLILSNGSHNTEQSRSLSEYQKIMYIAHLWCSNSTSENTVKFHLNLPLSFFQALVPADLDQKENEVIKAGQAKAQLIPVRGETHTTVSPKKLEIDKNLQENETDHADIHPIEDEDVKLADNIEMKDQTEIDPSLKLTPNANNKKSSSDLTKSLCSLTKSSIKVSSLKVSAKHDKYPSKVSINNQQNVVESSNYSENATEVEDLNTLNQELESLNAVTIPTLIFDKDLATSVSISQDNNPISSFIESKLLSNKSKFVSIPETSKPKEPNCKLTLLKLNKPEVTITRVQPKLLLLKKDQPRKNSSNMTLKKLQLPNQTKSIQNRKSIKLTLDQKLSKSCAGISKLKSDVEILLQKAEQDKLVEKKRETDKIKAEKLKNLETFDISLSLFRRQMGTKYNKFESHLQSALKDFDFNPPVSNPQIMLKSKNSNCEHTSQDLYDQTGSGSIHTVILDKQAIYTDIDREVPQEETKDNKIGSAQDKIEEANVADPDNAQEELAVVKEFNAPHQDISIKHVDNPQMIFPVHDLAYDLEELKISRVSQEAFENNEIPAAQESEEKVDETLADETKIIGNPQELLEDSKINIDPVPDKYQELAEDFKINSDPDLVPPQELVEDSNIPGIPEELAEDTNIDSDPVLETPQELVEDFKICSIVLPDSSNKIIDDIRTGNDKDTTIRGFRENSDSSPEFQKTEETKNEEVITSCPLDINKISDDTSKDFLKIFPEKGNLNKKFVEEMINENEDQNNSVVYEGGNHLFLNDLAENQGPEMFKEILLNKNMSLLDRLGKI